MKFDKILVNLGFHIIKTARFKNNIEKRAKIKRKKKLYLEFLQIKEIPVLLIHKYKWS